MTDTTANIFNLENALKKDGVPVEIETRHHFAKGLYAREITIPEGVILTGKIHKTEHLNIVAEGEVHIVAEGFSQVVRAPATLVAFPGVKKAMHARKKTVFITVHATHITDVEELERELVTESYAEIGGESKPQTLIKESGECHSLQ